jgi:hypothetical protein
VVTKRDENGGEVVVVEGDAMVLVPDLITE